MYVAPGHTVKLASDGGGEHLDPRAEDVLATTDPLQAGRWLCRVTATATSLDDSKAVFVIQRRNAADDDTLDSAVFAVGVDASAQFDFVFEVDDQELVNVVPYVDLIGMVAVAINYQHLT